MSNSPVERLVAAAATQTSGRCSREYPDVFNGTIFLVSEIDEAITKARKHADLLKAARAGRLLDAMADANAELVNLLDQSKGMTAALQRVIDFHKGLRGRPDVSD
jgi:VIT1/CCC1 family predicted Fe2+/Mn2+ transporter